MGFEEGEFSNLSILFLRFKMEAKCAKLVMALTFNSLFEIH